MPEGTRRVYNFVHDRAEDLVGAARAVFPRLPAIHVDFIRNEGINAMAFRSHGRYFIGLNSGTLFMLRLVIGRMLSDSRIFTQFGNPQVETSDLEPMEHCIPDADVMYAKETQIFPKDVPRNQLFENLVETALQFLVGHEITHIIQGHVDYLMDRRQQKITAELGVPESRDHEQTLERQCLEMNADRRSVISRVDSIRTTYDLKNPPTIPWRPGSIEHPVEMLFEMSLSIHILFRLFGDAHFSRTDDVNSAYPPLWLRHLICHDATCKAARGTWGDSLRMDAIRDMLSSTIVQTNLAFAMMLGANYQFNWTEEVNIQAAEHLGRLDHYWNTTLFERLIPYAYDYSPR